MADPKPQKPRPDFPLWPHVSGKWAKKVNGRTLYFGRWDDPDGALREYQAAIGRVDKLSQAGPLTLEQACNRFLHEKTQAVARGELSQLSLDDYLATCRWLADFFGRSTPAAEVRPVDFNRYKAKLAERRGPRAVGNEVQRVRVVFNWLWDARLIPAPVHFGPDFRKPPVKVLRKERRQQGKRLFTAAEVRAILRECGVDLKAMVLLGINCGFGNTDCATLPLSAVHLDRAWLSYPRPKTEILREIPLWPETVAALRESLATRPEPKEHAWALLFVRPDGSTWDSENNYVTKRFQAARAFACVPRGTFYWLRHTFETVAGGAKDQIATSSIMGHADHTMSAVYREEVDDDRLRAVTDHVRQWLYSRS